MVDDISHLVDEKYGICDLVDVAELRRIFERFTEATGFTIGFLDHPGLNVLIATGWRDICTKFHRGCPLSADICVKSNRHLLDHLNQPGKLIIESCDNGLVDCAFPIIVKGKHIASLATGQLLLEEPDLERFKRQAKLYGFDEQAYLSALEEIPVVSEEKLRSVTTFLGEMALVLSQLGYARLTAKEETERLEREIAARKQAEEALLQSERNYREIFNTVNDAIFIHDADTGAILDVNDSMLNLYGFSREEVLRLHLNDSCLGTSPYSDAEARQWMAKAIAEGPQVFDWHARKKGGELFWVEVALKSASISGQRRILALVRNITERKRMEAEQEKLQAQFTQAQKMESAGRLAGGVAHDFNNMLMGIMGYADLCRDALPADHPSRGYLNEITNASQRSADLTRQLLAFARKQTIAPKVLDLNDAITGMLNLLRRLIGENINMVWSPGANLWPIKFDPSQIDQILTNICVNARDAIDGVGKITIETATATLDQAYCDGHAGAISGEYVLLSVSDSGCGMTKDVLTKIFEPFYTSKDVGKGTGLGLATVYGIIKQNNGYIDVYSEPGKGTTFKIYLSRFRGEVAKPTVAEVAEVPRCRGETILLVEDEPALLKIYGRSLGALGYKVLLAANPAEAFDIVARHSGDIHLLFTDVVMPGMNGQELAKQLLASSPGLKVLFMSGYPAEVSIQQMLLDESVHFIQKPATRDDIARKVHEVLMC